MPPADDAVVISAWHLLVVVVLPLAAAVALLWRTWVKPAADERVRDAQWRDGTARDIAELRAWRDRHEHEDNDIAQRLDQVSQCLTDIRLKLARIEERMELRSDGR